MKVNVSFEITKMELDGHELSIPEGFSEFLNRAGIWEYNDSVTPTENPLDHYDRKVIRENGNLKTYLTLKGGQ